MLQLKICARKSTKPLGTRWLRTALSHGAARPPGRGPRRAGRPAACSPGFVLVGVDLHLVSHAEEPEIRKILFQLGEGGEKNRRLKQADGEGTGLLPSCGKINANACRNGTKSVRPEPFCAQTNPFPLALQPSAARTPTEALKQLMLCRSLGSNGTTRGSADAQPRPGSSSAGPQGRAGNSPGPTGAAPAARASFGVAAGEARVGGRGPCVGRVAGPAVPTCGRRPGAGVPTIRTHRRRRGTGRPAIPTHGR